MMRTTAVAMVIWSVLRTTRPQALVVAQEEIGQHAGQDLGHEPSDYRVGSNDSKDVSTSEFRYK